MNNALDILVVDLGVSGEGEKRKVNRKKTNQDKTYLLSVSRDMGEL